MSKSHNTKATIDNHVDLTSCDREPIHILSKIQSFGVLISVTPDWIVNHLSQNAHAFLQVDDKLAVGSSLVGVISDQALHDIRGRLQLLNSADSMERLFAVALFDDDRNFDVAVHRSGRSIIIEFEKTDSSSDRDYLNYIKPMISRIEQSSSVEQLSQLAARQLKAILNFDRVMVYRFLPDDTGEVIAEAKQPNMSSFLNLRYPASDIPKQARALYKRSLLRIISDVNDEGVPILPVLGAENEPLDLSLSITRAVSSIHLEYLKNMGVEASLSISIIVRGKLWGLFACHNTRPRNVGFGIRSMSELFAQMFSYVLGQKESEERAEVAMRGQILHDQIMTQLADGNSIADNFEVISNALASTIPYDGVSIWANGQYMLQGDGPNSEQFQGMLSFLNTTAQGSVYSTQNLSEKYPPAAEFVDVAAGY